MRTLVESLKRLYEHKKTTQAHIIGLLQKGKITQEEAEYILQKGENITV